MGAGRHVAGSPHPPNLDLSRVDLARWLVSAEAVDWIAQAETLPDPSSLAAGTALRRDLSPERAAAVLDLVALRRHAVSKLGPLAHRLFLTHDGLEQATRWPVAWWRAKQIGRLGITQVIDLGCGLGVDSAACLVNGVTVVGVERDPVTAVYAQANLDGVASMAGANVESPTPTRADVITADLDEMDLDTWLDDPMTGFFLDPARRTSQGRSWKISDMSPSWSWVETLMTRASGPVVVKLGPGFPRRLLPDTPDITWLSHHHDLVETTVWSTEQAAGTHEAVILDPRDRKGRTPHAGKDGDQSQAIRLSAGAPLPPAGPLGRYLYEPDPAVIRADAIGTLAGLLQAHPVADGIAYLTGDAWLPTDAASTFAIESTMPWSEKALRQWVRDDDIGVIEIKTRGIDIDPAALRRRLKPRGPHHATIVLTPTATGATAVIARRLRDED
jgi:hypothetical protein